MTNAFSEDPKDVEDIDPAQAQEDLQREPEEKQNREQSPAPDTDDPGTGLNDRQEEVPRAGTEPPA